ncbi:MAG: hypothetical protein JW744_01140 [Candidatus Diapherotrites archaeon]|uniref:TRASH domain-containing protein n=1 Tax=Candidatus Iainarchaeum sp. TaxID=3101447 RepID=A0A939C650_9ARCH|nr:hypothetical protein [Candidatus Diapherotrites archaeon]
MAKRKEEQFVSEEQDEGQEEEIEKEDDDIYDKEDREQQLEDDEITPGEAGFVDGYEDTKLVECNSCGNKIDWEKVIEKEINGTVYTFCSRKCADSFERRKAGLR